jgi:hypothetical protein
MLISSSPSQIFYFDLERRASQIKVLPGSYNETSENAYCCLFPMTTTINTVDIPKGNC